MPNRILKESITTSETINTLSPEEERLFYRLLVVCDDYGRFDGRPTLILARCFPLKIGKVTDKDVVKWIARLETAGLLWRYQVAGQPYLQMATWERHQQIRNQRSKYPEPTEGPCNQLISDVINGLQAVSDDPHAGAESESESESNPNPNRSKAAPASAPDDLKEFDDNLREFSTYVPNEKFYAEVSESYGHLNLRQEAIMMTSWLKEHKKRRCSVAFILRWLGGSAATNAARSDRPNGRHVTIKAGKVCKDWEDR